MEDFSKYNGEGTTLRKAQLRMLDILIEVDKICKKHNIQYWLDFGTLLGAIRHGGFIPWDDDLDIAVYRKDYKRLCNILKAELPEHFVFQDETTEKKYCLKFAKVRDKNSYFEDSDSMPQFKEQGIFIDIFSIEKFGNIRIKRFIDFFYGRSFRRIKHFKVKSKTEILIAFMMWPFACLLVVFGRCVSFFISNDIYSYSYGIPFYSKCIKRDISPCQSINFEGIPFSAPTNYDSYLRFHYGDYMKIPPEEKRAIHSKRIEFKNTEL